MKNSEKIAEEIIHVVEKSILPGTLTKAKENIKTDKEIVYVSGQSYDLVKKRLMYYIENKLFKED